MSESDPQGIITICRRCGKPEFPWRQLAIALGMTLLIMATVALVAISLRGVGQPASMLISGCIGGGGWAASQIVIRRFGRRKAPWLCGECTN